MMVDWTNAYNSGDGSKAAKAPFKSLLGQIGDKTFLTGTSDLIEAFTQSDKADEIVAKIGSDAVTSLVPNLVKQAGASDREQIPELGVWGKGSEWVQRLGKRTTQKTELGIYGDQKKYDLWGREISTSRSPIPLTDWAYRMSIPIRKSSVDIARADQFILAWNKANPDEPYFPMNAPKSYKEDGRTLYYNDEDYARFAKVSGGVALKLTDMLELDADKPTKEQLDSVKEAISTARSVARDALAMNPNATVNDAVKLAFRDISAQKARSILANEPKSVTAKEKSEGVTLGVKKRGVKDEARDARNWIKDSGLDKAEVESAVWDWIKGDLTTKEGQLDKMKRFQKSMGWSQWERWRKSP